MRVAEIMTAPVLSVAPTTSIADAAQIMLSHRISGLPVVAEDGSLVGMVTEGDFLRRSELGTERKRSAWLEFFLSAGKAAEEYVHSHGRRVEDVMTTGVVETNSEAEIESIVEVMGRRRIKRLPVVDGGKLVGIVARSDLLKALSKRMAGVGGASAPDDVIHRGIVAELGSQSWSGQGLIRVDVERGAVVLSGTIFDERERQAARVAAENVAGVLSVKDQLVCVEPISGVIILPERTAEGQGDPNKDE